MYRATTGIKTRVKNFEKNICVSYFIQRFDHEMAFELHNETSKNVDLEGKYMYFLSKKCTGENHNAGKDDCGKVEIHNFWNKVRP